MKVDNKKILVTIQVGVLMMALCLSAACSSFKELSLFKSKSSQQEKVTDQSSGHSRLFDYSEITQWDSSFFNARIWVDGDFRFHQDSGIRGEKAMIQYVGKQSSILQLKDSLISQQDSSSFREHIESQTNFIKTKEKTTRGYSWLFWAGGILVGLWLYYRLL
jgi:hypothetical protein